MILARVASHCQPTKYTRGKQDYAEAYLMQWWQLPAFTGSWHVATLLCYHK